jgi:hypothetical protein
VIKSLRINGDLIGDVFASSKIGNMSVAGDVVGTVIVSGLSRRGMALKSLTIGGDLLQGALNITGSVGRIQTLGGLGTSGDSLQIFGNLNQLIIGAATSVGTALAADLSVTGNLGRLLVNGLVSGEVSVLGSINRAEINANPGADALTGAGISAQRAIKNVVVRNGNVAADITAERGINSVQIIGGNLSAGSSVTSNSDGIRRMQVLGGHLFGSVMAPNGALGRLEVDGNIGDGVTPLSILARSAMKIQTHGSILSGVTATINGPLKWLIVDGNVEAGATISGAPILRTRIGGANNGTIVG